MRLGGVEDEELGRSVNSCFRDSLVDSFLIVVFQRHVDGGVRRAAISSVSLTIRMVQRLCEDEVCYNIGMSPDSQTEIPK